MVLVVVTLRMHWLVVVLVDVMVCVSVIEQLPSTLVASSSTTRSQRSIPPNTSMLLEPPSALGHMHQCHPGNPAGRTLVTWD